MNRYTHIFLVLTLGTLTPCVSSETREINKFDWSWEEPESRDVICSLVSPSGDYVVCGTHNKSDGPLRPDFGPGIYVCKFALTSNQPVFAFQIPVETARVNAISCSYNADIIAFVANQYLYVLDGDGNELWHEAIASFSVDSVAVSLDGNFLAAGNYRESAPYNGPTLFYFSVDNSMPLWAKYLDDTILWGGVHISDNGRYVVATTTSRNLRGAKCYYFDTESADPSQPIWIFQDSDLYSNSCKVAMTPDGTYVALEANNNIFFFDNSIPTDDPKAPLWVQEGGGYSSSLHDISLTEAGDLLAYAGPHQIVGTDEYMGSYELWDTAGDGTQLWAFEHFSKSPSITISMDGSMLYYGGDMDIEYEPEVGAVTPNGDVLWTYPVTGHVDTGEGGERAVASNGVVVGFDYRDYHPLYLFSAQVNQEP
ncbi:hypothetical protein JW905_01975, partial [bacterium]|nr:hypothetical protein [candidate division CSSED10-310 bacterium]